MIASIDAKRGYMLTIIRIPTTYNEGHNAAVLGEPMSNNWSNRAIEGYLAACKEIEEWRKAGGELPWYIDPEKVTSIFEG